MKLSTLIVATTMMFRSATALVVAPVGYRQIGQTLHEAETLKYGSIVELSDNGERLAVAADAGSITIFDRDDSTAIEDIADATWQMRLEVPFGTKGRLSLSGDGKLLAVRRLDSVEVFDIDSGAMTSIDACQGDSQNVKLGKTLETSIFGAVHWLLISCESHDQNRGKVDLLRLDDNQWIPFTTILGQNPGAKFGWDTAFNVHHDQAPMVAVASPFFDGRRGLVQVFSISYGSGYTQQGNDVIGQTEGDKFGFSIAMSTTGLPHLVVGAPDCLDKHGCVSVYDWSREGFGQGHDWEQIGSVITGDDEEEAFGRAVAISKSGTRIAASSVRSNIVRLYEHDSNLTPIGLFEGSEASQWGFDISLNDSGSMLVSGSVGKRSRSVQVFIDDAPFCGHPIPGLSNTELFLARPLCDNEAGELAFSEMECVNIHSFDHGTTCEWITNLGTRAPSSMPSVSSMPSASPSVAPSASPSSAPSSFPSASPSTAPSMSPSSSPSSIPSMAPSASPSSAPSASPSSSPSVSPSAAPSPSPSVSPTGLPSESHSQVPSSVPSSRLSLRTTASRSASPAAQPSTVPAAAPTTEGEDSNTTSKITGAVGGMIVLAFMGYLGHLFRNGMGKSEQVQDTSEATDAVDNEAPSSV